MSPQVKSALVVVLGFAMSLKQAKGLRSQLARVHGEVARPYQGLLAAWAIAGRWGRRRRAASGANAARNPAGDRAVFQHMREQFGDGMLKLNADMVVEHANDQVAHLLGRPASDLIGASITPYLDASALPSAMSGFADAFAHGGDRLSECRLIAADGSPRWVAAYSRFVDGHCYSVLRDITDWRREQAATAREKRRLEWAAISGPGVVCGLLLNPLTRTREVTFISPVVEQVTGYTVAEASERDWPLRCCDPRHAGRILAAWRALEAAQPVALELMFRHKAGHSIWLHMLWRPSREDDTGLIAAAGYLIDVTERKQQEARAMQAAKMTTVGEVAASIAHELNQPLAIISFAAENAAIALAEEDGIASAMKRLERIRQQVERAAGLVRQIRMFSGMDATGGGTIDLALAMDAVQRLIGHRLRGASVRVERRLASGLPAASGDAGLLEQVLANLLINACEAYERQAGAARDRVVTIDAGAASAHDGKPLIRIAVADHAGGIDPALIERVFEPFFSTKPAVSAVGLGLSFCYGAMNGMGGTITAQNSADGAVLLLTLPAAG